MAKRLANPVAVKSRAAAGGVGDAAGPKAAGGGRRGSRLFARSRRWARRGGAQGGGRRALRLTAVRSLAPLGATRRGPRRREAGVAARGDWSCAARQWPATEGSRLPAVGSRCWIDLFRLNLGNRHQVTNNWISKLIYEEPILVVA
ncbi:uncharacterized protein [Triticum aestivum]|uniref:uncharacterized protein n=1 Tax=Triticum aestivum TaxID=4565 RepID=UPI001D02E76E|nr:uncharacterized protein LOC123114878 [Triticum aestivum]